MSWKDFLRPASYGGVSFGVRDHNRAGGRRVGVHQFVLRDTPFVEDLGRMPKTFDVEGYIVGDDYVRQRDRLIAKLETPGPGHPFRPGRTLVHPTHGILRVVCTGFRVSESTQEGRMVRITMSFVEAGETATPNQRVGQVQRLDRIGEEQSAAAGADFEASAVVDGVPETVRDAIADKLQELGQTIQSLDVFGGTQREVAALQDDISNLIDNASKVATSPPDTVALVQSAVGRILDAAVNFRSALFAYEALFLFSPNLSGGSSNAEVQADSNSTLISNLVTQAALVGAGRSAARSTFESQDEAEGVRGRISEEIDTVAGEISSDAFFAVEELRGAVTDAVPPPGTDLPRLRSIELRTALPALVVSFDLYGTATRDAEIISRNAVRHPLRIPASDPLQVLSS